MQKNKQNQEINCPECGAEIAISEVLTSQLEKSLRKDLQTESDVKLKEAVDKVKRDTKQASILEIKDLENQLEERQKETLKFRQQSRELETKQARMEDEIEQRVKEKEKCLQIELKKKLSEELSKSLNEQKAAEFEDLKTQIEEKESNLLKAQALEITLRKQTRELETKQKELDIQLERKLDERAKEIECDLAKKYDEESNLKLKQKEQQIESLRRSLEDAKRKSEQGSMETQGEALEVDLECRLKTQFTHDEINPVSKGVRGADIIHTVLNSKLQACGKILWEAKNTKSWSQAWVQKLKDDQLASGANIAILVSVTLPQGLSGFEQVEGVWVCSPSTAIALACALREQLIAVNFAHAASIGKDEKMERMFSYLSGDEFRQRIEAIVSAFEYMQLQILKERRAMEKQWREREKQIDRIMINTSGMYGDMRGIIGSSVQEISALELDANVDANNTENAELDFLDPPKK